jgi:hypothetical protein
MIAKKERLFSELAPQVVLLHGMPFEALRGRYTELFGEPPRSSPRGWLVKRIAWRLQALAEGDLSERARQRASEIANDADLRLFPPRPSRDARSVSGDRRLPAPGTILARRYKGQIFQVKVLTKGFEYDGALYRSLSAVAKKITGSHCNGYLFFRLIKDKPHGQGS